MPGWIFYFNTPMLTDLAMPKYNEIHSLLNELYELEKDYEGRVKKANALLFENKLTEPQKIVYDQLTKQYATIKNSALIMHKVVSAYDTLIKIDPVSPEWEEQYKAFIQSNQL